MSEESGAAITFFAKHPTTCPVCGREFKRENVRTGRGRMIAGELTDELRRLYEPTEKYGEVYPLIYPLTVCPECYYAAFQNDFTAISDDVARQLEGQSDNRINTVQALFKELDFERPRGLEEGIASYYLAISSMESFPPEMSPTIKRGLSALRAAWLCGDLHRKKPGEHYDYVQEIFYHKAWYFYRLALQRDEAGKEGIADVKQLGPDVDQNYGYDGVLLVAATLEYKYGPREDAEKRRKSLEKAKATVGRLFGLGKASKNKPQTILERARELHRTINEELKGIGGES
jgi:hypothetical protein